MNVYVALISHVTGMIQTFEEVKGFNTFMLKEVQARGYPVVLDPQSADVILMLPTWQHDKECFDEYKQYRDSKMIVTSLESLEQLMKASEDETH